jgi:hypothetical protein
VPDSLDVILSSLSHLFLSTDYEDFHRFTAIHLWQSVFICGPMFVFERTL